MFFERKILTLSYQYITVVIIYKCRYVSFFKKNRVTHENEKDFKQHDHILVCTIMQTPLF